MCNLNSPFFNDEETARKYLEAQRWPDGAICPHCGGIERNYPVAPDEKKKIRKGLYQCNDCDKQFTVTVGTVFERSKVPLHKWLLATYLLCGMTFYLVPIRIIVGLTLVVNTVGYYLTRRWQFPRQPLSPYPETVW